MSRRHRRDIYHFGSFVQSELFRSEAIRACVLCDNFYIVGIYRVDYDGHRPEIGVRQRLVCDIVRVHDVFAVTGTYAGGGRERELSISDTYRHNSRQELPGLLRVETGNLFVCFLFICL